MGSTLRKHVTGKVRAATRALSVPDRHALRIARKTMTLSCVGAQCMGGPDHHEAAETIHRLTGAFVGIDFDCYCRRAAAEGR